MSNFIPNSFQLPNAFVDEAMKKLSPTANLLYVVIVRKTRGWQKNKDAISLTQFEAITGLSRKTVIKAINELIEFGFVKEYAQKNAKAAKSYALNDSVFSTLVESPLVENLHLTSGEIPPVTSGKFPHTKTTIKTTNTKTNVISDSKAKFSFVEALKKLGANDQLINDWLAVRKTKKASNNQTSFSRFESQLSKANLDINTVLRICIERDWKGFDASWLANVNLSEYQEQTQQIIPEQPATQFKGVAKKFKGMDQ